MIRPARLAAALLTALVLLAGCGGADDSTTTQPAEEAAEESTTEAPQPEGATEAKEAEEKLEGAAGEDEVEVPDDLPVVATRPISEDGVELEVDLNSVSATGEVMTVLFTVRNIGDSRMTINRMFDDGSNQAPLDDDGEDRQEVLNLGYTSDGVTVIDPAEGMMHRAAYDDSGRCACSGELGIVHLEAEDAVVLTTSFAAPPQSTEAVTVSIPLAGAFEDVPLIR